MQSRTCGKLRRVEIGWDCWYLQWSIALASKGHRLRKSISIFRLLHLEERIGCSASALRELEVQLKEQIIAYGQAQAEASHGEQPIGIWVGGDETFWLAHSRGHGISQWIYLQWSRMWEPPTKHGGRRWVSGLTKGNGIVGVSQRWEKH